MTYAARYRQQAANGLLVAIELQPFGADKKQISAVIGKRIDAVGFLICRKQASNLKVLMSQILISWRLGLNAIKRRRLPEDKK